MTAVTLTIDGRTAVALEAGDPGAARTIVFLHAFPFGPRMWDRQFEALARANASRAVAAWRILSPAFPGFDGSERIPETSVDGYARHVLAYLDHRRVSSATFVGLSLGGYVAFGLLRQAPERVERLVLADTRSAPDSPEAIPMRRRLIELALGSGPRAVADDLLPKLLGPTTHAQRPEVVSTVRRLIESQSKEVIADTAVALMTRPDSGPLLPSIRVPTCIIVGEEDSVTPPSESEKMCAAIPGSTLVRLPDAGHMANLEDTEAFNKVLLEFVGRGTEA